MRRTMLVMSILGCFMAMSASAFAAVEFSKVGSEVTIKAGEVDFEVPGMLVGCNDGGGSGKVTSKTEIEGKVAFEQCSSSLGKQGKAEAKMTACSIDFLAGDKATLEGVCKIESEGCIIEATGNKELSEADYITTKEGEKGSESEVDLDLDGVSYVASTKCNSLGIEKGKEGNFETISPLVIQGAAAQGARSINVESASMATPAKFILENSGNMVFTLGTKSITCGGLVASGKTASEANQTLAYEMISITNCKTNILNAVEEKIDIEESCANTEFQLRISSGSINSPYLASGRMANPFCGIKGKIMGQTCTVIFPGFQEMAGISLENVTGPPNKMIAKFGRYSMAYYPQNCGTALPAGVGNFNIGRRAVLAGEAKLNAKSTGGSSVNIEVR